MAESTLDKLLADFEAAQEKAEAANLAREAEIRAITDEIIARYQPGGPFEAAGLAQLATAKTADIGTGMQNLIASGLAGTEAAGQLETAWEQAVGAPARLSLEDLMMQRLSAAQMGKAEFIEGIENVYPDYTTMAQLAMEAAETPDTTGYTYSTGEKSPSPWEAEFMGGGWSLEPYGTLGGGAVQMAYPAPTYTPSTGGYTTPTYEPSTPTAPTYEPYTPLSTTYYGAGSQATSAERATSVGLREVVSYDINTGERVTKYYNESGKLISTIRE